MFTYTMLLCFLMHSNKKLNNVLMLFRLSYKKPHQTNDVVFFIVVNYQTENLLLFQLSYSYHHAMLKQN
jgi:hypothetical protein